MDQETKDRILNQFKIVQSAYSKLFRFLVDKKAAKLFYETKSELRLEYEREIGRLFLNIDFLEKTVFDFNQPEICDYFKEFPPAVLMMYFKYRFVVEEYYKIVEFMRENDNILFKDFFADDLELNLLLESKDVFIGP